ncbi:hypothetical protein JCM10908_000611 [Rhodotorula pacifica]|uniref:uncharacterized protein n=1 Tax=Rhodotorula pacifica TaxID=1495444 RepID=UPI00316C8F31
MPAPQLPIELVRYILGIIVARYEWEGESATPLITFATVSKAWKPVVEELALHHVEVDIGGFELCGSEMRAGEAEMAEKSGVLDYVSAYPRDDTQEAHEYLEATQRRTAGLIACDTFVRNVQNLDIRMRMRHEKQPCSAGLDALANLCQRLASHRAASASAEQLSRDASEGAEQRMLDRVQISIYQEEWVVQEWAFRKAIKCLAMLGPLDFLSVRYTNEGDVIMSMNEDEGSSPNEATSTNLAQDPTRLEIKELELNFPFVDIGGSAEACEIVLVKTISRFTLQDLTYKNMAHLPPPAWGRDCKNLKKLQLDYSRHRHVLETAESLLAVLPMLSGLLELRIECQEIVENELQNLCLFVQTPNTLRRFPSPYSLSAFLKSLPASISSVLLWHTHFQATPELPELKITPDLKAAFEEKPHARVYLATPEGEKNPAKSNRLVMLTGANGQDQWTLLLG